MVTENNYDILRQYKENSFIQIYENFFSNTDELKKATSKEYTFGWKSNRTSYDQGHWNNLVSGEKYETDDPFYDISNDEDFYLKPFWETIQTKLGHRRLRRVYFNGYTYGTDGYFHKDSRTLDTSKFVKNSVPIQETILCYCNEKWNPDWAGETVFMSTNDETTMIASVLPKINRVVVFNGEINHVARPVSRAFNGLRTILAFKTIRDFYDEKNAIDFIRDLTDKIPHSGRTFFNHLYRCMEMLKNSNFPQEVYLAALYHSIYDTEFFKADLNIPREKVRELIGPYSENLVHLFCTLRPRTDSIINYNQSNIEKYHLSLIEYVNLIEQGATKDSKINELFNIIKQEETLTRHIKVQW